MNDERFSNDVFHSHPGIERAERILKDDLHIAAKAAHFVIVRREQVTTIEANTAGGGLNQTQHQPA